MASGKDNKVSRRQVLQMIGVGSAGLLLGAGGIGPLVSSGAKSTNSSGSIGKETDDALPFYGTYQQGITTPQQDFLYFAAFDIVAKRVTEVRELFQTWCHAAARMSQGDTVGTETANPHLPPTDTGEALGLSPSRLTFTFGVGPSLFVQNGIDRFGIAGKRPAPLIELPPFAGEELQAEWGGGDIGVQVCANDPQVAFHAVRNLARLARGVAVLRWSQAGFQRTEKAATHPGTARNLMGFKDGTGNPEAQDQAAMNEIVWAQSTDNPAWMTNGSYMVVRKIRMRIEVWDRSSLQDQESSSKKAVEQLSKFLENSLIALGNNDWEQGKSQYRNFEKGWSGLESGVRKESFATYANMETRMSLVHVALGMQTPDQKKAISALQNLIQEIQDYLNGNVDTTSKALQGQTIGDLLKLLANTSKAIDSGDAITATNSMVEFIEVWPSVEGQVQTRSPKAYTDIEIQMTQALEWLSSSPPNKASAHKVVQDMKVELEPFVNVSHYTAFDAGMILFREGLEALLVVSALLAFLQRTGNRTKQVWIWTGVGSGLAVSAGLATVMSLFFSSIAAGIQRETMEGITGLVAVVMMFTVGVWLHSKSNGRAWNQYIYQQMDTALARGSLWSLTIVSFLSIFREGAETIIFYLGMVSSIEKSQLLIGIGGAMTVLLMLGAAIVYFSVRIPIKPFFLVASVFIYYIAFKFLGESVHVLQIQNWVSTHTLSALPTIDWMGIYPTWESSAAQAVLLAMILVMVLWNNRKQSMDSNTSEMAHSE